MALSRGENVMILPCAFAVKTRKEAKRIAIIDSISSTKTKVEQLKKIVQDQRAMRDEYAAIIYQQASGSFLLIY